MKFIKENWFKISLFLLIIVITIPYFFNWYMKYSCSFLLEKYLEVSTKKDFKDELVPKTARCFLYNGWDEENLEFFLNTFTEIYKD